MIRMRVVVYTTTLFLFYAFLLFSRFDHYPSLLMFNFAHSAIAKNLNNRIGKECRHH